MNLTITVVTSVVPLNSDQEYLINELKSLAKAETVKLTVKQDNLLGGLVLKMVLNY